jgi:hypothetical protein
VNDAVEGGNAFGIVCCEDDLGKEVAGIIGEEEG